MKTNIKDIGYKKLKELVRSMDQPAYRADQIFGWLAGGITSFDEMKNVPAGLIRVLSEDFTIGVLDPLKVQISRTDGTRKYLFELSDGNAVESVFMKYKYGNTVCVSSQAGCRMGCRFCASTLSGLCRSLTPGEMYEQILAAERNTGEKVNHVVIMGSGEPFDNYDNVSEFIDIINEPKGLGLGMRSITVSTCGIIPYIERFSREFPQVNLAISLHAATDNERSQIMPVNRKYPLKQLIQACRKYTEETSRRITFEYTLVKDVNDSDENARTLADLLHGMLCHVNLIPLNKVEETGLDTSPRQRAQKFRELLEEKGINATIRRELGDDIDGACGQLRLKARASR